jgi:hypothetical protein
VNKIYTIVGKMNRIGRLLVLAICLFYIPVTEERRICSLPYNVAMMPYPSPLR